VYQLGTLFTTGLFGAGFLPGLIAVSVMLGVIVFLMVRAKGDGKIEYTLE
jgi:ferrous iron transport protein B